MSTAMMTKSKYQTCIDECNKCEQVCYECFRACLNEPDVNARKSCISMLIECVQMCQMSSAMMAMEGQFSKQHCGLCATVCDKCAQECEMFNDDHCKQCAVECRTCADECRKMTNM
jgi:hypothetical protein